MDSFSSSQATEKKTHEVGKEEKKKTVPKKFPTN